MTSTTSPAVAIPPLAPAAAPVVTPAPRPPAPSPKRRPVQKYTTHRLVTAVSLAPPSVRTQIVLAWSDNGFIGHETIPVLLVQASIVTTYCRASDGREPILSADPKTLEAKGWWLEETGIQHDLLVWEECYGVIEARTVFDDCGNTAWQAVVCPWPVEEDPDRLAKTIEDVRRLAVEAEQRSNLNGAAPHQLPAVTVAPAISAEAR